VGLGGLVGRRMRLDASLGGVQLHGCILLVRCEPLPRRLTFPGLDGAVGVSA
jgi:hypothetical protein